MVGLYSVLINMFTIEHGSSFLSANAILNFIMPILSFIGNGFANLFKMLLNGIMELLWVIIKFVLGIMEAFEYMINQFLGLDSTVEDVYTFVKDSEDGPELLKILSKSYRAVVAISIVLLIIFTIIAIIKQEYANFASGMKQPNNDKKPIITGLFKKMLYVLLLPIAMMFIITGVNSILTAFSRAMQGGENITIAAQMLSTSTYDSNKYRYYALQNKRMPILIKTYDADSYDPDENDLLVKKIQSNDVQNKLRSIASDMVSNNLLSFNESVTYKNNKLSNSVEFDSDYEKFVCTAEQYQVMADFVDYAQKHNLSFQIKSIDDEAVDWKYVDSAVFNPSDVSLKINYRDANDIDGNGKTSDSYTIEYSSSFEVTSPISDAMETIMALLGIDSNEKKYSQNLFKTMERDENYVNVVNWATDKVWIQLKGTVNPDGSANPFNIDDPSTWSRIDQLIIYEYYHFSSNNTFGNYTINDLIEGVELDASQITYREYYAEANAYSKERTIECVKINGSYYRVEKDPTETDEYGNIYYVLKDALEADETGSFLNQEYAVIEELASQTGLLTLSSGFKINDPTSWSYSDQILVYEFYKDLSSNNALFKYDFNDFVATASHKGEEVPVYNIVNKKLDGTQVGDVKTYILLNGTYYQAEYDTTDFAWKLMDPSDPGNPFHYLYDATSFTDQYFYNYSINLDGVTTNGVFNDIYGDKYGISTSLTSSKTAEKFIIDRDDVDDNHFVTFTPLSSADDGANFDKYSSFSLNLSQNFNYNEVDTWTYRDYFIFYLYVKYPGIAGRLGLDSLRVAGVSGEIGSITPAASAVQTFVYQVKYGTYVDDEGLTQNLYLYLDIDAVRNISNLLINNSLNSQTIKQNNYVDADIGVQNILFIKLNSTSELVQADTQVYKFELSEDFNQSSPQNWTVMDYILYKFSEEGVISPLDDLKENGYVSVVYTTYKQGERYVENGVEKFTRVIDDVYYKFGSSATNKDTYLSLNSLKALTSASGESLNYDSISDLNASLLDFIAQSYGSNKAAFITNQDGIVNNLYNDLSPYIYSTDTIIEKILDSRTFDIGTNEIEIYDNISTYTYSNPDVLVEDLSTWTVMDAFIYCVTGEVRTHYTSNVISYGGTSYFIVDDKAIDISSSSNPFRSTLKNNNSIESRVSDYSTGDIDDFYNSNYKDYVYAASSFNNKKLTKYSDEQFVYKKVQSGYTVLDIIYEVLTTTSLALNGQVSFDSYSDGENVYLEVNGTGGAKHYVLVSTRTSDYISIRKNSIIELVNNSKIVAPSTSTYKAFRNVITDTTDFLSSSFKVTKLDAIIYLDTYSLRPESTRTKMNPTDVKLFVYGNDTYAYTGTRYVRVDTTSATTLPALDDEISTWVDLSTDEDIITMLYTLYYKSYVSDSVVADNSSLVTTTFTYERSKIGVGVDAELSDVTITKLSPLAIILAENGIIDLNSEKDIASGKVVTSGGKTYFRCENTDTGRVIYVNITNLGSSIVDENNTATEILKDNKAYVYEMILRYLLISNTDGGGNAIAPDEYASQYSTFFDDHMQDIIEDNISVEGNGGKSIVEGVLGFRLSDASTWSHYNILNYYLSSNENLSSYEHIYTNRTGDLFVKVKSGTSKYKYIKITSESIDDNNGTIPTLTKKYTKTPTTFKLYDDSGNYNALGIIGYKQTALDEGSMDNISYGSAGSEKFYYFQNSYTQSYSAVYGLGSAPLVNKQLSTEYVYQTISRSDVENWGLFDYLMNNVRNSASEEKVYTNVYVFGSNAYILINGKYLNLTNLSKLHSRVYSTASTYFGGYNAANVSTHYFANYDSIVYDDADIAANSITLRKANTSIYGDGLLYTRTSASEVTALDIIYSKLTSTSFIAEGEENSIVIPYYQDVNSGEYYLCINDGTNNHYVKMGTEIYLKSVFNFDYTIISSDIAGLDKDSFNVTSATAYYTNNYTSYVHSQTDIDALNTDALTDNDIKLEKLEYATGKSTLKYYRKDENIITIFDVIYTGLTGIPLRDVGEVNGTVFELYLDRARHDAYILVDDGSVDYYVKVGEGIYFSNDVSSKVKFTASIEQVSELYNSNIATANSMFVSATEHESAIAGSMPDTDSVALNQIGFSKDFNVSDYSTWKLSDFVIYYLFDTSTSQFQINGNTSSIYNFQTLVNQGYSPAKEYKYYTEDQYGNSVLQDVIWIGIGDGRAGGFVVNKTLFDKYYSRQLVNITYIDKDAAEYRINNSNKSYELRLDYGGTQLYPEQTINEFFISKNTVLNANDFTYDNYYFFNLDYSWLEQADYDLLSVSGIEPKDIITGEKVASGSINIQLSSGFNINNPSTWTWFDLIIVIEYSRTSVRHNFFEGMSFDDLRQVNYIPYFVEGDEIVIELNGVLYDLSVIKPNEDDPDVSDIEKIRRGTELKNSQLHGTETTERGTKPSDAVSQAVENSYNIKTLYESIKYTVKDLNNLTECYSKTPNSILYVCDNLMYYMEVNTNLVDNYNVNIKKLNTNGQYDINTIVRQVNWPQKLMNDIQTLYPDLNWATLIATDGWLDTLGEFTSAQASGEYVTEGNAANITAAGLVLSEFFVSVATETEPFSAYTDYEYKPIFDTDTIHSLMLSMLGEEEFNDLSMQAEIFIEMFNNLFLPVLEEIAAERGVEIVDGKVDNFYVSVYKAYLATLLLGSDMGEYFYKVATRVYAQYTIFDSLASASDDYAAYLDYINSEFDDEGNKIDTFMYSSFYELAMYENSFTGNKNPTFTFNFKSTLEYFIKKEDFTYKDLRDNDYSLTGALDYDALTPNEVVTDRDIKIIMENESNYSKVINLLDKEYQDIYMNKNSKVKDSNESGIYCFMLDVYWSIHQEISARNQKDPSYLKIYRQYVIGEIKRWGTIAGETIDQSSEFIPNKEKYDLQLLINKIKFVSSISMLRYSQEVNAEDNEELKEKLENMEVDDILVTSKDVLEATFTNTTAQTEFKKAYYYLIDDERGIDLLDMLELVTGSENGDTDDWQEILKMQEYAEILANELGEVLRISGTGYVEDDTSRGYRSEEFTQELYDKAKSQLEDLKSCIDGYVAAQHNLDRASKASITFTLAQFGKNYVTEGYTFSFENKKYTMTSTTSAERLAEYVYGGSFLVKFGVAPRYTNENYNGFIESYKVYDSQEKTFKTKLNVWSELREFVSQLANYTSRLYYLSNMNNLAENVGDGILLTNYVNEGVSNVAGSHNNKTLEYMILEYLLGSEISADTFIRLSFGDTVSTLDAIGCSEPYMGYIKAIAHYLEGTNYKVDEHNNLVKDAYGNVIIVVDGEDYPMTSSVKKQALSYYWSFVASDDDVYNSNGYYNDGTSTSAERVHKMFKKVISYLVVSEEAEKSASENAINLDNITFKQFKRILMKALSDYQKNPSETDLENSNRYITLFNLICSQFSYTYDYMGEDADGDPVSYHVEAGTAISPVFVTDIGGISGYIHKDVTGARQNCELYAEFSIDIPTRDIILTFAGIENRPIEELVGLEYDSLYDRGGNYDEADGDVFVVCTYNEAEGKYYPVMARNSKTSVNNTSYKYIQDTGIDLKTTFYDTQYCYPIIAKGVIDASGYPTAIKIVNNSVVFYRTSITTASGVGDAALNQTRTGGEVTTIGYTKYTTGFWSAIGNSDKVAMYNGSSSIDSALTSDTKVYFLQSDEQYSISDPNNFDSISVLEDFSAFYTLEYKQLFMFLLGFSTLLPILFKASATVLRRILDLIFLVLAGPLAISTLALSDGVKEGAKSQTFETWKNYMTQTLLHVFGYTLAFNSYFIITSTVLHMDLVSDGTMEMINRIGGLSAVPFLTESSINSFLGLIYAVAAAGAIKTCADLLVNIVTAGKVSTAFSTPMGGDVMADIKKMATDLKDTMDKIKGVVNGQALMQLKDAAIETAINTLPGGQIAAKAVQKVQNAKSKKQAKELEEAAIANGVAPEIAKKMSNQFVENEMKQRDAKRKQRAKNANAFMKTMGGDGDMFKAQEDGELKKRQEDNKKQSEKNDKKNKHIKKKKKEKKKKAAEDARKKGKKPPKDDDE